MDNFVLKQKNNFVSILRKTSPLKAYFYFAQLETSMFDNLKIVLLQKLKTGFLLYFK